MRPEEIRDTLRRRPFPAFRVHLSDGSTYEVRHPEMAYVSRCEVVIGVPGHHGDLPVRSVYCDPIHVTRIEPIDGS